MSRRAALAALAGLAASSLSAKYTHAHSREIPGGRVTFRIPWQASTLDPHRADDVTAAILGDAIFETLYAPIGSSSEFFLPVLAEAEPTIKDGAVRVVMRGELRTAHNRPFGVKDAAASIARARSSAAQSWLSDIPSPHIDGDALVFATRDANKVMRALASPLVAIVPRSFRADAPDGTGPFRAERTADGFTFTRNPHAASGPSFLEGMSVKRATDLSASLRAFESGEDDLGWLGAGLHEPRPGSMRFDAGSIALAVLRTGHEAAAWDAPGVAQSLADGILPSRLSYLGIGAPWASDGSAKWGGSATAILTRDDSPWLIELARAVAGALTTTQAEVTIKPVSSIEIDQKKASRGFTLMIDAVRPFARDSAGELAALAASDDPRRAADIVRRPTRGEVSTRVLARSLRVGVLGEVRVSGGRVPDLRIDVSPRGSGIDWGNATRGKSRGSR